MEFLSRKKASLCIIVVCLLTGFRSVAQAQDSLFYFSTVKVKGMYKTFDEFRRNAPSIPLSDKIVIEYSDEETLYEGNLPVANLNCDSVVPCEKKTPIWGFCDGTSVFISRSSGFDKKNTYDKVRYIGRYLYYQCLANNSGHGTNTGPGSSTGGYTMGGSRSNALLEKGIDINTGATFELSIAKVTKILSNDKVLAAEFKKEKKKEKRLSHYLKKYAEKHKEQIKK
jgi:hypothetical protein